MAAQGITNCRSETTADNVVLCHASRAESLGYRRNERLVRREQWQIGEQATDLGQNPINGVSEAGRQPVRFSRTCLQGSAQFVIDYLFLNDSSQLTNRNGERLPLTRHGALTGHTVARHHAKDVYPISEGDSNRVGGRCDVGKG